MSVVLEPDFLLHSGGLPLKSLPSAGETPLYERIADNYLTVVGQNRMAELITGWLSFTQKMPSPCWDIPATRYKIGSVLAAKEGTTCYECYARMPGADRIRPLAVAPPLVVGHDRARRVRGGVMAIDSPYFHRRGVRIERNPLGAVPREKMAAAMVKATRPRCGGALPEHLTVG